MFEMKNIGKLLSFSIKTNIKTILGWCIAIFSIMFMYMILFPSMEDMASIKLEAMPEELLQFMGMEDMSSLSNFSSYFGMIYSLILIAISIFTATFSSNLIAKEEKNKTIEFLYSFNVTKTEIYVSKVVTAVIASSLVIFSAFISTSICGFINGGDTFKFNDVLTITKISAITVFFFMSFSFLISGATTKISTAMLSSGFLLILYVLGYLGKLLEDKAKFLVYLSPFETFNSNNILDLHSNTIISIFVYCLITLLFFILGGILYNKRDFNV